MSQLQSLETKGGAGGGGPILKPCLLSASALPCHTPVACDADAKDAKEGQGDFKAGMGGAAAKDSAAEPSKDAGQSCALEQGVWSV